MVTLFLGFVSLFLASASKKRRQAEEALRESEGKLQSISSSMNDALVTMDNRGKITYWNESAEKIFGYGKDEVRGRDLHQLLVPEKYREAFYKGFVNFVATGTGAAIEKTRELSGLRKDGTEFPLELSLSSYQADEQWHAVGTIRDISDRKLAEQDREKLISDLQNALKEVKQLSDSLQEMANTDHLTELYNRRGFRELLEWEFEKANRYRRRASLLLFDLDHFKNVNDTYGHQAGDDVLIMVARKCRDALRKSDILCRYGGEEFIALLPETGRDGALNTAERLRQAVESASVSTETGTIKTTISIGIAFLGDLEGLTIDRAIKYADDALYSAKTGGRNRISCVQF